MFITNKLTPQMLEHDTANVMRTVACSNWAPRMCDTCRVATCTVFCRVDSAYLCAGCDVRVHAVNHLTSQHERVWVCEACERAPAEFLCKADAASLCSSCDADIHSANLLASRHHRVPIMPISGFLYGPPATQDGGFRGCGGGGGSEIEVDEEDDGVGVEDEDEAASWLLLNPMKNNNINSSNNNNDQSNGFLFGGEVEEYLDLVDCNSCDGNNNNNNQFNSGTEHYGQQNQHQEQQQQHYGVPQKIYVGDSVVPVQQHQKGQHFQLGLEFESPKAGFSCNGSNSQSVSISSIDIGIVPESTMRDVSISHSRPPKGTIDLFSGPSIQMSCHLTPMDREARVLRYREKKKTRKFEKTIRYASRKAYAETRPRIKGRFAKRSNAEAEVDQIFSSSLITEVGYGIVPSF